MKDKTSIILVTGSDGQLGSELKVIEPDFPAFHFLFVTRETLDISNLNSLTKYFEQHAIDFCINCAAYTAVDKAETEKDLAFSINADAVALLARVCALNHAQLIHISTDYVFDGNSRNPYKETDKPGPLNVYGRSKLMGEEFALQHCPSTVIIRTAWLYSAFANNFVKSMLRLMREKDRISVVNDQIGCPTYAADLALAIMHIIESNSSREKPGIYHYSDSGITNWYEFAVAIKDITGSDCRIDPIPTEQYPTAAKRPAYTILDTTKIREQFKVSIPFWKDSLHQCMALLK